MKRRWICLIAGVVSMIMLAQEVSYAQVGIACMAARRAMKKRQERQNEEEKKVPVNEAKKKSQDVANSAEDLSKSAYAGKGTSKETVKTYE